jgi:hypothetical protein
MAEIGLFEAMYTARALRRLKPDPVPEDLITKILEAGTQRLPAVTPRTGFSLSSATRLNASDWARCTGKPPTRSPRSTPPVAGRLI